MQPVNSNSLPATRRSNILEIINSTGCATIKGLAQTLDVSEATIRRDLDELNNEHMLERIHGGAQALKASRTAYESAYHDKSVYMVEEKAKIGAYAATHINDGDTILLDSGTTTLQIAHNLSKKKNITVITHDLYIASSIELDPSSTLIVPGGTRRAEFGVLIGPITQEFIQNIRVDKTFLSADAVDSEFGVSNATVEEANLKKALISSGQKVYLVADHSKFSNLALVHVCSLAEIDLLISDSLLPRKEQTLLDSINSNYFLV